jgi:hypothetical protein
MSLKVTCYMKDQIMKIYLKLYTAILTLFMSMNQQTTHTIKPTNTPMLKLYFSHNICHNSDAFYLDHPHRLTDHHSSTHKNTDLLFNTLKYQKPTETKQIMKTVASTFSHVLHAILNMWDKLVVASKKDISNINDT